MVGVIVGLTLISLDHLYKDESYIDLGVLMVSSISGYWLPEPRPPRKMIKTRTKRSRKDRIKLLSNSNPPKKVTLTKIDLGDEPVGKCDYCRSWFKFSKFKSKKGRKIIVFCLQVITSIVGLLVGIGLAIIDIIRDDGPYLTISLVLISSIISYWLPSPSPTSPYLKQKKSKPISKKQLQTAKIQAKTVNDSKKKRLLPFGRNPNGAPSVEPMRMGPNWSTRQQEPSVSSAKVSIKSSKGKEIAASQENIV